MKNEVFKRLDNLSPYYSQLLSMFSLSLAINNYFLINYIIIIKNITELDIINELYSPKV